MSNIVTAPKNQPPAHVSETTTILDMIERFARDPSVDLQRLERLMDLHERVTARNAKAAYAEALSAMQPKLPIIQERGRIDIGKGHKAQSYALWEDINEQIMPVLAEHGFAMSFRTGLAGDGRITVTGILSHRAGHQEETMMVLPHDSSGSKNAVQAIGSSTSYGKRYTACALLNISSRGEDDDGKAGGGDPAIDDEQIKKIQQLIVETASDIPRFCRYMKVSKIEDIRAKNFDQAIAALEDKKRKSK